jgi:hypothetical protein
MKTIYALQNNKVVPLIKFTKTGSGVCVSHFDYGKQKHIAYMDNLQFKEFANVINDIKTSIQ